MYDYGIINRSSLNFFWSLQNTPYNNPTLIYNEFGILGFLISYLSQLTTMGLTLSAQFIMLVSHLLISLLVLSIARVLKFSNQSCWALILLLLAHPSYNDFRSYIIVEPLYWVLWLTAVFVLLRYYRENLLLVILIWLVCFIIASQINITAWFWLTLFPIGILFWPQGRRKSVIYSLLLYIVISSLVFFIPFYNGQSSYDLFTYILLNNSVSFSESFSLASSDWLQEDDWLMAATFIFSGGISLVLLRTIISFGLVCSFLAIYAVLKKQSAVIDKTKIQLLLYLIIFDILTSVLLFILSVNKGSTVYFSNSFLLFIFAALGLSYIFKKIEFNKYPKHIILVIVWCIVAYIASGFISFGPDKSYLKTAGQFLLKTKNLYSNNSTLLYYAGYNPDNKIYFNSNALSELDKPFTLAYSLNRNESIPHSLASQKPTKIFTNQHKDKLIIYKIDNE